MSIVRNNKGVHVRLVLELKCPMLLLFLELIRHWCIAFLNYLFFFLNNMWVAVLHMRAGQFNQKKRWLVEDKVAV